MSTHNVRKSAYITPEQARRIVEMSEASGAPEAEIIRRLITIGLLSQVQQ